VGVRFSNHELAPFWGAGLRFSLAALTFVAIALALRLRWPTGRLLALTAAYGLLSFGLFYALMYWALQRVTAGMARVVMAMVPVVSVRFTWVARLEPLRRRVVVGAAVALGRILWMTVGEDRVLLPLTGLLGVFAGAVTIGESDILG